MITFQGHYCHTGTRIHTDTKVNPDTEGVTDCMYMQEYYNINQNLVIFCIMVNLKNFCHM